MKDQKRKEKITELREHVRDNIQVLHSLLMALAIGNAIRQLAVLHSDHLDESDMIEFGDVDLNVMISALIGIFLIFRFFLGERLAIWEYNPSNGVLFAIDIFSFFTSSVIIAYLSFFVIYPLYFYMIFTVFLVVEGVWWILRLSVRYALYRQSSDAANIPDRSVAIIWVGQKLRLSTLTLLIVLGIVNGDGFYGSIEDTVRGLFSEKNLGYIMIIFGVNIALDLVLNGPRYVGLGRHRDVSRYRYLG